MLFPLIYFSKLKACSHRKKETSKIKVNNSKQYLFSNNHGSAIRLRALYACSQLFLQNAQNIGIILLSLFQVSNFVFHI